MPDQYGYSSAQEILPRLLVALKEVGGDYVEADYSGGNDEGGVDDVRVYRRCRVAIDRRRRGEDRDRPRRTLGRSHLRPLQRGHVVEVLHLGRRVLRLGHAVRGRP